MLLHSAAGATGSLTKVLEGDMMLRGGADGRCAEKQLRWHSERPP
jgi:hypothetical protein